VVGEKGRPAAAAVLTRLREQGNDPAHGGEAARQRGRKNARHQKALRAWRDEPEDPMLFQKEILPALRTIKIGTLTAATGLSEHYCSLIRLGKRVPHPRHWGKLRTIADQGQHAG